jgi:hypothetical protein
MARSYGHIMSAIWNDAEWRKLDGASQRVYLMLVTQAKITSAGTLDVTLSRWSQYASDTPSDALCDALSRLEDARYIFVDYDTEELLVRKFVKWDGGYSNEKRRPAITAAANALVSQRLRASLAIELDILHVPHALSDTLSDTPSGSTSDTPRVVVTEVGKEPQPTTLNPEPVPSTLDLGERAPSADAELSPFCSQHPNGHVGPCRDCGTARVREERQKTTRQQREEEHRKAQSAARAACTACDPNGWLVNAEGKPSGRCNHRKAS